MVVLIFFTQTHQILILYRPQRFLADIKELYQSFPGDIYFLFLVVQNESITTTNVVAIEWLLHIYFIFIRASSIQGKVNNGILLFLGVLILDRLESFVVLGCSFIEVLGVLEDFFSLANLSELLFFFGSLNRVSLLLLFFIFGFRIHWQS